MLRNTGMHKVLFAILICTAQTTPTLGSPLIPPKFTAKNLCDTCIEFPTNTAKITIGIFSFSVQAAKAGQEWAEELYEAYGAHENISLYVFGMLKELDSNDATKRKRLASFGKKAKKALYEKFLRSYLEEIFHPYVHIHVDSQDTCAYQEYLNHTDPDTFYTIILDNYGTEVARFSNMVEPNQVQQVIASL